MIKQLTYSVAVVLLCVLVLQARQASEASFVALEKAVKEERAGWAGDKRHLSTVFDAERKRLGDRFESELLKWLGNDPKGTIGFRRFWKTKAIRTAANVCRNSR